MGFVAYQLAVTATAKNLVEAFPADGRAIGSRYDVPLRSITFQLLKASTTDVFLGDSSLVSSTIHGLRVDPSDTAAPIVLGGHDEGPIHFSDFWAIGTGGEVLLISGIPY
jgi:hypothetical protein